MYLHGVERVKAALQVSKSQEAESGRLKSGLSAAPRGDRSSVGIGLICFFLRRAASLPLKEDKGEVIPQRSFFFGGGVGAVRMSLKERIGPLP